MLKLNIKKQISRLYLSSVPGNLSLTGAWVAILAARGYSLVEIGLAETIFHITSLIFEIPSGVLADVFGRKNMLIVSSLIRLVGNVIMIFSGNLFMVCASLAFQAVSYNFASGSGVALFIGHRIAYSADVCMCLIQIGVLMSLYEEHMQHGGEDRAQHVFAAIGKELVTCFAESLSFLKGAKRAVLLMFCNSFVGRWIFCCYFSCRRSCRRRVCRTGRSVLACL